MRIPNILRPLAWVGLLLWIATMDDGCAKVVQWHQDQGTEFHNSGWFLYMPSSH